jgi:hypothetical protein
MVVFLALAGKWLRASGIARRGHGKRSSMLPRATEYQSALSAGRCDGDTAEQPVGTVGKVDYLLALASSCEQEVCLQIQAKESTMSPFILLLFVLVIASCVYGYMTYRTNAERQAREKKRNQYHDRV